MIKIGIVGTGAWGEALSHAYAEHTVILYSRRSNATTLRDLANVDYLLVTLGAQEVRSFFDSNKFSAKIVVCSKGIDTESGDLLYNIVKERVEDVPVFIMTGPNFAHEIKQNLPAVSSIASEKLQDAVKAAHELSTHNFKLFPTEDIITASFAGSLKNVLAIMCGVIRALELGENFMAAAITKGIKEISDISIAHGGKVETIFEPAFIGDVFLTCNSVTSRNTKFGINLIKNNTGKIDTVEGLHTSISLNKYYSKNKLPLLHLAHEIISGKFESDIKIIEALRNAVFS